MRFIATTLHFTVLARKPELAGAVDFVQRCLALNRALLLCRSLISSTPAISSLLAVKML
jgi:hypothetical protein